jgi:hypothetical protein
MASGRRCGHRLMATKLLVQGHGLRRRAYPEGFPKQIGAALVLH